MRRRLLWPLGALVSILGCGSNDANSGSSDAAEGADSLRDGTVDSTVSPDAAQTSTDASGDVQGGDTSVAYEASSDASDASSGVSDGASDVGAADGASDASPHNDAGDAGTRICDPHCGDVLTWHNDNVRSGQNLYESVLTLTNVNSTQFGKLFVLSVDGKVDAQPLVVSAVDVAGKGSHDIVIVVTEHDSVYAFDAKSNTGANASALWQVSLLGASETTSDTRSCSQVVPEIGITSTPVVDLATGTLYVVVMSKMGSQYFQRLHALDIKSGGERSGSPVTIQATASGPAFDPKQYKERAGLLLNGGALYLTWGSHCDIAPYNGWVMSYDPATLQQKQALNFTPNGSEGSNWAAGAGPAADTNGNIYFLAANGTFDATLDSNGFPAQKDFGNAMMRISTTGSLAVTDYFATWNTVSQSAADTDFGSGGAMLLPDEAGSTAHPHLIVGAGKDGNVYLVDRDHMGKWNGVDGGNNNKQIVQEIAGGVGGGVFSSPAYFNHAIYYGDVGAHLKRFSINGAHITTPAASASAASFAYPGTTPSISADGAAANPASTAIVWAIENANPAVLHAYTATDLTHELYNSSQAASSRDSFGTGNKYIVPTVANGHVYAGTVNGVGVFGLLN